MAFETKTKTIKSTQYDMRQFGALQGRKVLARLLQTVGPAIGAIGGSPEAALALAISKFDSDTVDYLCDSFAPFTTIHVNGKGIALEAVFNVHYAGNYGEMLQWLAFALEVNYASFFADLFSGAPTGEAGKSA